MNIKVKRHFNITNFNQFSLLMKHDSVASAFSFLFYFDPEDLNHKELFQVGHYHQLDVEHNDELLLRGFILNQKFTDSENKQLASISGYSLPGVLEDCNIPLNSYPLQYDGQSLREITQKIVNEFPFNLKVDSIVSAKADEVYETTTANEGDTIKGYITSLAAQKDIIVSHTNEGDLLFTKSKTRRTPLYHFDKNVPGTSMSLSFNGQAMHSHITVFKDADIDGGDAGQETIRNPFVPFVYRPLTKTQDSGGDNDTADAAKSVLAKELKNIVLTIKTSLWEIDGKVIKPNNIITVINKDLFLYNKTDFFIESVQLTQTEKETTATLTCVIPEVYNGQTPEYIFTFSNDGEHS